MRTIATLALKDLRILARDKSALFWVVVFPLLMAVLFGAMFGGGGGRERAKMKIGLVDEDNSKESRAFAEQIGASDSLAVVPTSRQEGLDDVRRGKLTACLILLKGFSRSMPVFTDRPAYEVGIDPSRTAEAGFLQGLLIQAMFSRMTERMADPADSSAMIAQLTADLCNEPGLSAVQRDALTSFMREGARFFGTLAPELAKGKAPFGKMPTVPVTRDARMPTSGYQISFPQALLWGLIGSVITFAVSIVRERTLGTLLRLRVAPIPHIMILAGKAAACATTCVLVATALLLIGIAAFGLRVYSPLTLVLVVGCAATCFTGIMMLLSVLGRTEQAVGGSSSGVTIIMAMFGGGMIPLFIMPGWMQAASNFSPGKWAVLAFEGALWRQFTPAEMLVPCTVLVAVGALSFAAGALRLRHMDA
ncbi:MAG: ABC transporter permease [Acidobacteriota bacterium]